MKNTLLIGVTMFVLAFWGACDNPSGPPSRENNPPTFSVTYHGNGHTSGAAPIDSNSHFSGATVTVLDNTDNLVRSVFVHGEWNTYTFIGWNTRADGNGTSLLPGETFTIFEDIRLYAQWQTGVHALTLSASALIYSNNHQVNGVYRNALTPIQDGAYTERSASFTVEVRGFTDDNNARNVGLAIQSVPGLSFSGYDTVGNASGGTKTFTVTVTLLDTMAFASGSVWISITGLTNVWQSGYVFTGGITHRVVNIIDGRAENRAIPVNQGNILAFNAYAHSIAGWHRHYRLMENVNLPVVDSGQSNWTPIGRFYGSFDGQGYAIRNLTIDNAYADNQGLFGVVLGSVRNLGLHGGSVSGWNSVGGIAGVIIGIDAIITNSYNTGDVIGRNNVGGVAGILSGRITNSHATGNVSGVSNVGGVTGRVIGYRTAAATIGGSITNSFAAGNVSGTGEVGGVAGFVEHGLISNSFATGNVSATGVGVAGGVVGRLGRFDAPFLEARVANSFAAGYVSGTREIGGVVGHVSGFGHITNSYATGNVSSSEDRAGGVAGYIGRWILPSGAAVGSVTNSFAAGNVSGGAYVGGVAGYVARDASLTNSVALNARITRTGGFLMSFGRVAGFVYTNSRLSGTHAYSGMIAVGGITFQSAHNHNGHGASPESIRAHYWWRETAMFRFGSGGTTPWRWDPVAGRPRLYWE